MEQSEKGDLRAVAAKWRNLAHSVAADMKGTKAPGSRHNFKPTGLVKARMGAQCSVLLTCATELEAILDET